MTQDKNSGQQQVDMTAKEFWTGGMFTLDFLNPAEQEVIIKGTELYAKGKQKFREGQQSKMQDIDVSEYYKDDSSKEQGEERRMELEKENGELEAREVAWSQKVEQLHEDNARLKAENEGHKEIAIARGEAIVELQNEIERLKEIIKHAYIAGVSYQEIPEDHPSKGILSWANFKAENKL